MPSRLAYAQLHGPAHHGGEVVGAGGEQVDGLVQVPPHGGHRHLENGREAGKGVAVALVGQSGQRLLLRGQPTPAAGQRAKLVADQLSQAGQVVHGQTPGWRDRPATTPVLGDTPRPPTQPPLITMKDSLDGGVHVQARDDTIWS